MFCCVFQQNRHTTNHKRCQLRASCTPCKTAKPCLYTGNKEQEGRSKKTTTSCQHRESVLVKRFALPNGQVTVSQWQRKGPRNSLTSTTTFTQKRRKLSNGDKERWLHRRTLGVDVWKQRPLSFSDSTPFASFFLASWVQYAL